MTIRLSMGHVDDYDDRVAAFARQLGLTTVQLYCLRNLPADTGHWTLSDLRALRQRCHDDGLEIEGLENVPVEHFGKVQRGEPGRDEQFDNYIITIRNMAAAGIFLLGYNFLVTYVWRTTMGGSGRGGARLTGFDLAQAELGSALANCKLTPPDPTEPLDPDTMWDNHQYFLDAVLAEAELADVRLALHPDDPHVAAPLGGAARIFTTPQALQRAHEQAHCSPNWGLNLCLGIVSEIGGERAVTEVIDSFGPPGKIFYVHFRDVRGTVPAFDECFLGEGNYDPASVIKQLAAVGFDRFLIDDHVPAIVGDLDTWGDTSSEAYCNRGRAHAISYLQAILATLDSHQSNNATPEGTPC